MPFKTRGVGSYASPCIWNSLPIPDTVNFSNNTVDTFKARLDRFGKTKKFNGKQN